MTTSIWQLAEGKSLYHPLLWEPNETIAMPASTEEKSYEAQFISSFKKLDISVANPTAEDLPFAFSYLTHTSFHAAWVCFTLSLIGLIFGFIADRPLVVTIALLFFAGAAFSLLACISLAKRETQNL